jgi:anti-anti-sigma factor
MEIQKKIDNSIVTLSLIGRLDTNTASELEAAIHEINSVDLILDCEKLEYVSSAGLRVLLLIQKKVNNSIKSFTLTNVCEDVKEVLHMTGFLSIINIK